MLSGKVLRTHQKASKPLKERWTEGDCRRQRLRAQLAEAKHLLVNYRTELCPDDNDSIGLAEAVVNVCAAKLRLAGKQDSKKSKAPYYRKCTPMPLHRSEREAILGNPKGHHGFLLKGNYKFLPNRLGITAMQRIFWFTYDVRAVLRMLAPFRLYLSHSERHHLYNLRKTLRVLADCDPGGTFYEGLLGEISKILRISRPQKSR